MIAAVDDRPGSVVLVGAGPGDPDLMTVAGARELASAEVVVHDRLVDARVLQLAPPVRSSSTSARRRAVVGGRRTSSPSSCRGLGVAGASCG